MLQRFVRAASWVMGLFLARPLALAFDAVLRSNKRDGKLPLASQLLLVLANAGLFLVLLYQVDRSWALWAIVAALLLQGAVIIAALLIIAEETQYWDGLMIEGERTMPPISCVRTAPVLLVTSISLLALAGLLCQHIDLHRAPLLKSHTDFPAGASAFARYVDYLLVCLHHMPIIGDVVEAALEKLGRQGYPTFDSSPEAIGFRAGLYVATGVWMVGAFRLAMQQWADVDALSRAIDNSRDPDTVKYLQMRAARAPGFMKRRMLRNALSHPDPIARRRYITICYFAHIRTFPQSFIFHLQDQNEFNKVWGLRQSRLLLDLIQATLEPKLRTAIINAACHQIRNNDHKPGIVARMWNIANKAIAGLTGGELAAAQAKMLALATEPISAPNNYVAAQKRLLDLCSGVPFKAFPQSFVYNLDKHTDEVKLHGLRLVSRHIAQGLPHDRETVVGTVDFALRRNSQGEILAELREIRRLLQ